MDLFDLFQQTLKNDMCHLFKETPYMDFCHPFEETTCITSLTKQSILIQILSAQVSQPYIDSKNLNILN